MIDISPNRLTKEELIRELNHSYSEIRFLKREAQFEDDAYMDMYKKYKSAKRDFVITGIALIIIFLDLVYVLW